CLGGEGVPRPAGVPPPAGPARARGTPDLPEYVRRPHPLRGRPAAARRPLPALRGRQAGGAAVLGPALRTRPRSWPRAVGRGPSGTSTSPASASATRSTTPPR